MKKRDLCEIGPIGVRWDEWVWELCCWIFDPHKGLDPVKDDHIAELACAIHRMPLRTNPWRKYFVHGNTPWEAHFMERKAMRNAL